MKKIAIGIMCLASLIQADTINSTHSSYYNNQVNSNNIDNSSWFSNNKISVFGDFKRDYQAYMGGESLVYVNGNYDMDSYMNRKEVVLQLGIYEKIYFMYGKGKYSQKASIDEYEYTVTGLSYHLAGSQATLALEWYESKFDKVTNSAYESKFYPCCGSKYEKDSVQASELNNNTLMLRFANYLDKGHTGLTVGMGIDNSGLIMSFGLSLRYF